MKKQKYFVKTILSLLLVFTFLVMTVEHVSAETGAQVQTKGEIILFDDPSSSSSEPTSSISTSSSNSSDLLTKPKGRLPSTGELIKYSFFISGIVLILLLLFCWINHQKNKGRGNE